MRLPVLRSAVGDIEPVIAQVADGRDAGGQLGGQRGSDDGLELVVGIAGDPVEGTQRRIADEMGMGVDETG